MLELNGPVQKPIEEQHPRQLVIFLHGLGADGHDLFSLVPYFQEIMPDAYFIAPHAPFPCDMAPYGYQWFSLLDRKEEKILTGITKAEVILNHFIDQMKERLQLEDSQIVLIGFSQGTMLALHTALRRKKALAGILGYSGALVGLSQLKETIRSKPPLCLIHGEEDNIVPFQAFGEAIQALKKWQVPVYGYSRKELGHGIDPAGIKIGQDFFKNIFVNTACSS